MCTTSQQELAHTVHDCCGLELPEVLNARMVERGLLASLEDAMTTPLDLDVVFKALNKQFAGQGHGMGGVTDRAQLDF